jgi:hypothetical protein
MNYRQEYQKSRNWKKKAKIVHLFHSTASIHRGWKKKDTAEFFGISPALVSEEILIVNNLKLVEKCKSRNEALKLIRYGGMI